jgi:choline dehydrogenase-like flavoprotein
MAKRQHDIVVVGGGAAGCVVAARLAETSSRSILVLEAGPDLRTSMPEAFRDGFGLAWDFDWGYESEPDERGVTEGLRRGKLLGGTSWLTRFAFRGPSADYDEWEALGNPGWRFEEVLPYFRRLEVDLEFGHERWHGADGRIPVTRYPEHELTEIAASALEALQATGFPPIPDHNAPGALGAGRLPMSSRGGVRLTTADAYLPVGATPSNLFIRADTQVSEVVFDGARARGVRLLDGSEIEAGRVVLSAGTYGTPAILLRSGIGPAEHLRSLGIPVRVELDGVGANLADHQGLDIDCGYEGPARDTPVLHLVGTFRSSLAGPDQAPDLMLWLSDPGGDPPVFEIDAVLLRPHSRGSVRLRSADPADPPVIDLPGIRDPADVERLAEGYARGLEVARRQEIRRLCPSPPEPTADDRAEIAALVRTDSYHIPHVVGTCAMGPRSEDGAVVDIRGRVHGTDGLSVVDASIVPNAPSAFSHLPAIMLAERLAEEIAAAG